MSEAEAVFCDTKTKVEFLARQCCVDIISSNFDSARKVLQEAERIASDPSKCSQYYFDGDLLESVSGVHPKYFVSQMSKYGLVTVGDLRREMPHFVVRMEGPKKSEFAVYYKGNRCRRLGRKIYAEMKLIAYGRIPHKF